MSNATDNVATKPIWKRPLIRLMAAVILFVALRGFVIAYLLKGRYRLTSLLFDCCAALIIMLCLQLLDRLLTKGLTGLFGDDSRLKKVAIKSVRLLMVVLFFGTFLLATVQMHPPKIGCAKTPVDFSMSFSEHRVTTEDGVEIAIWSIPAAPNRPTLVVTHGLGANKQNFLPITMKLHELNYNIVAFDFRGHGDSGGHTCTLGVNEAYDVKAAFDLAKKEFPGQPIYAWSTSLGGATTLRASAEYQIFEKVVVDATYSSIKEVAMDTKFCYLGPLASPAWEISRLWFAVYVQKDIEDFGPEKDIANIKHAPLFLIHGTADPIIPFAETRKLIEIAPKGTTMWLVEGAGHSGSYVHPEYFQRVKDFFEGSATNVDP